MRGEQQQFGMHRTHAALAGLDILYYTVLYYTILSYTILYYTIRVVDVHLRHPGPVPSKGAALLQRRAALHGAWHRLGIIV